MPIKTFREFIERLRERGELMEIDEELSLDLEVPELLRQLAYRRGPAVVVRKTKEGTLPLIGNLFGDWRRVELVLEGVDPIKAIENFVNALSIRPISGLSDLVKAVGELKRLGNYAPKIRRNGPVRKVEWEKPDLTRIPAIRQWPYEPGKFFTFGITFVKFGNSVNFGYYRLQVISKRKFIIHWMPWRRGELYGMAKGEIAVVFGVDPITALMAGVAIPHPLDKAFITGVIRGRGLDLLRGVTVDVLYPADAELVIEGRLTGEIALEGPFGDHVGVYSIARHYPVVEVTAIYSREDPIIPVTVTGKPSLEDANILKFASLVVKPLIRALLPEVVDIYIPPEGLGYVYIISIKKRYPGHAKRVMLTLWGLTPTFGKIAIVVDHDIDVRDWGQVIYAIAAHVNPHRDVLVIPDYPIEELDPSTPIPGLGGRLGIDATRKLPEEYGGKEYPKDVEAPPHIAEKIRSLLRRYGILADS